MAEDTDMDHETLEPLTITFGPQGVLDTHVFVGDRELRNVRSVKISHTAGDIRLVELELHGRGMQLDKVRTDAWVEKSLCLGCKVQLVEIRRHGAAHIEHERLNRRKAT